MGKLYVVGFGPGGYEHMTEKAIEVIKNADVVTGYTTYVNILKEFFPDKNYLATPMMQEVKRCQMAAFKRGKMTDSILRVVCTLGISMPSFVVASVLLVTMAGGISGFKLFPTIFDASAGWRTYVLPCFSLGFYPMCYTARQTRSAMLDSLNQEYIKTARAKGLKNSKIIFKHALRNALIPVITYLGPQIPYPVVFIVGNVARTELPKM